MKVFLIGMPGSGKSTIGKALAKATGWTFIDLDEVISSNAGRSIPDIFSEQGEEMFRQMESAALQEIVMDNGSLICATGGGTPCFGSNLSQMKSAGVVIYLKVAIGELKKRLLNESEMRPLLAGNAEQRITELYNKRHPVYSKAGISLEASGGVEDIVRQIQLKIEAKA